MDSKAISASNLKLKLKLTEAELGNSFYCSNENNTTSTKGKVIKKSNQYENNNAAQ